MRASSTTPGQDANQRFGTPQGPQRSLRTPNAESCPGVHRYVGSCSEAIGRAIGRIRLRAMVEQHEGTSAEPSRVEDGGSKGVSLAVAGVIVAFFAFLPFVFLVSLYVFLTIYAIVRTIGPGTGENAVAIVVGFVLITSMFAVLLGVTIHLVGRSLTPRKRRGGPWI